MTNHADMAAYARLTRELTNMHASERDALDANVNVYRAALDAILRGDDRMAALLVMTLRTDKGDAWRVKRFGGKNFLNDFSQSS